MSWPNRITLARILLIVPFMIFLLYMNDPAYAPWARRAALLLLLIVAAGDVLDGWLARKQNSVTPLGTFLDPLADKLLVTCACILLSVGPTAIPGAELPDIVVVVIISKDLYTVLGFIIILLVIGEMKIVPVTAGRVSTMLQLSMVVAILLLPDVRRFWSGFHYMIEALWWSAAVMAVVTAIIYTRNGSRYISEYEQRQRLTKQANADKTSGHDQFRKPAG